ncbi:hypothetical protein ACIRG5_47970 [Lentzea sp. NPDC102401]|uniref:hypothetical protein n=1 Tax=Lentzea sp. NPDC102401 TaxID=3364128 RepID=UPI00380DE66E
MAQSLDELLTNITLYWFTNTAATSARLYYEAQHNEGMLAPGSGGTPTGFALFAKEIVTPPEELVRRSYT